MPYATKPLRANPKKWEDWFAILQALYDQGLEVNVAQKTLVDGRPVGIWLSRQRALNRQGRLDATYRERLESISVSMSVPSTRDTWERYYQLLLKRREAGESMDCPVTATANGKAIGKWAAEQRINYRKGDLSAEKVARLQAIGFPLGSLREYRWKDRFAQLKQLCEAGHNVNVWSKALRETSDLGGWITNLRTMYRDGKLPAARIEQLRSIGFHLPEKHDQAWERHYVWLQARHRAGESVNLPRDTAIDGLQIGAWVANQRYSHRSGKLSAERTARLEAIGFAFNPIRSEWERHFAILKARHESGQDANVPPDSVIDGVKIGYWLGNLRYRSLKRGNLSAERMARLEAIGITWAAKAPTGRSQRPSPAPRRPAISGQPAPR